MTSAALAIFKVLVFVARAASGKSESLTCVKAMLAAMREELLHIGREVSILDDYPYVHLMRRIDEELVKMGLPPMFFVDLKHGFIEPQFSWKLLVMLLNGDYEHLVLQQKPYATEDAVKRLLVRMDHGRRQLGARPLFYRPGGQIKLTPTEFDELVSRIQQDVLDMLEERNKQVPQDPDNTTTLIEFARGAPYGAVPPFPYAYDDSFSALDPAILKVAAFLYLRVHFVQALQKNWARCDPNDPASILSHGVPFDVMLESYGEDDYLHLLETSGSPGHIRVETLDGQVFHVPAGVFDNSQVDHTSWVREYSKMPWEEWPPDKCRLLGGALREALEPAWEAYAAR